MTLLYIYKLNISSFTR